jgi:hypothetical protein
MNHTARILAAFAAGIALVTVTAACLPTEDPSPIVDVAPTWEESVTPESGQTLGTPDVATPTPPTCTDAIADAGGICQGTPEWELPQTVTPEPAVTCQEDEPCWDCRFDGNERCGVQIHGVWYIIQFRDGSPEGVTYR